MSFAKESVAHVAKNTKKRREGALNIQNLNRHREIWT